MRSAALGDDTHGAAWAVDLNSPLHIQALDMIGLKTGMAGSCVQMVAAEGGKADLPTHMLRMSVMTYFTCGEKSSRGEFCCIAPAKYTSDATDIGYDEMPRPLLRGKP